MELPERQIWRGMIHRCHTPISSGYPAYSCRSPRITLWGENRPLGHWCEGLALYPYHPPSPSTRRHRISLLQHRACPVWPQ